MAVTLTALEQETLRLLNEAANSGVGELVSGTGGAPTSTTTQGVDLYLQQGAERVARTCVAIRGAGSKASHTGRLVALKDVAATEIAGVSSATGYKMWRMLGNPKAGSTLLVGTREAPLAIFKSDYQTGTGLALYWYPAAGEVIGLYPAPSISVAITGQGLFTPPAPSGADATPWLADDLSLFLIPRYAAIVMCERNPDDPSLQGRLGDYAREWRQVCAEQWIRLPDDVRAFFPVPVGMGAETAALAGAARA